MNYDITLRVAIDNSHRKKISTKKGNAKKERTSRAIMLKPSAEKKNILWLLESHILSYR